MKITARFRWQFTTWRACRAGALERAGCCWASPRGRRAAPRWGPGQPIRGEYCGGWTNHSSPGGCSHPTRSRTQSSGSASSGHVEQWHWARIKAHWGERQHRHPAFSYSRLSEVAMFMLNICGRCPSRAKHGDNAWKHSEIWVNGEWWGPALEKHSPRSLCSLHPGAVATSGLEMTFIQTLLSTFPSSLHPSFTQLCKCKTWSFFVNMITKTISNNRSDIVIRASN